MKTNLAFYAVTAAVAAGLSLNACAKKQDASQPVAAVPGEIATAWKLKLSSECSADTAASTDQCRGGYGFSVAADGLYQVGPGPDGQVLVGSIKTAELESLSAKVAKLTGPNAAFEGEEKCAATETAVSSDHQAVEFSFRGRSKRLTKSTSTELCYNAPSQEDAEAVHKELQELVRLYYPIPFPDACINAALEVEKIYAPLQGCVHDSDCAYVSNTFEAIPDNDLQLVLTDDCSVIPQAIAANRAALGGKQAELLAAREQARTVCGDRIFRLNCEASAGFQANEAKPVCQRGVCRKNPAVVIR